jgi:hypothetical protein
MEFREVQQFRRTWLWTLILLIGLPVIGLFGYGMVQQFIFGRPWGDEPLSNPGLLVTGLFVILLMSSLIFLFYRMELITEVRADGLYLRFWPFVNQQIPFNTIKACYARVYSPIKEYGGWGIRFGWRGKAYNVSGNRGVQLEFFKGRSLLIGSQQPEGLVAAIQAHL